MGNIHVLYNVRFDSLNITILHNKSFVDNISLFWLLKNRFYTFSLLRRHFTWKISSLLPSHPSILSSHLSPPLSTLPPLLIPCTYYSSLKRPARRIGLWVEPTEKTWIWIVIFPTSTSWLLKTKTINKARTTISIGRTLNKLRWVGEWVSGWVGWWVSEWWVSE